MIRYRRHIVALVPQGIPALLGYLLISTPFIVIEEAFTCDRATYGDCIPAVIPSFWLLLLFLYPLQRYLKLSWRVAIGVYGVMGCVGEFFIVGRIAETLPHQLIVLVPLCILIYAVVAIPSTYWLHRKLRRPE